MNIIDARGAMWKKIIDFQQYLRTAEEIQLVDFEQVISTWKDLDTLLKESLNAFATPSVSERKIHQKLDEIINYDPTEMPKGQRELTPSVSEILVINNPKFLIVGGKVFNTEGVDFLDKENLSVTLRSGREIHVTPEEMKALFYVFQCNKI
jgi:hypothetical protein